MLTAYSQLNLTSRSLEALTDKRKAVEKNGQKFTPFGSSLVCT